MIWRSIKIFVILAAFLAVGGCAQEAPATFETVLPQKPKTQLPPFSVPNSGNPSATIIQNP